MFAISVPVACPVAPVSTNVFGSLSLPVQRINLSAEASQVKPKYFVVDDSTYYPYQPKYTVSTVFPEPSFIRTSSTVTVAVFIVVVSP